MCLEVAARNFTTRVLPNQDTFAEAGTSAGAIAGPGRLSGATNGGAKSVGKRPAAATARNSPYRKPQKKPRGIGAKSRKGDSDDEKYDFKPSSDEEEENRNGSIGSGAASSLRQRTSTRGATTLSSSVDSLSNETTSAPLTDLKKLDQDDLHFLSERNRALLKILPSQVAARLLTLVATYHPHALTRHVLGTYFVSGRSIVSLNGSLPLFSAQPSAASLLLSSAPSGNVLRTLRLSGLTRLEDRALRGVFARCTALETVVLRGCVKVGASSIEALVKTCGSTLRTVNLDFTDVGAEGVKMLVQGAPRLEVMKLAGVGGLVSALFAFKNVVGGHCAHFFSLFRRIVQCATFYPQRPGSQ